MGVLRSTTAWRGELATARSVAAGDPEEVVRIAATVERADS